MRFHPKMLLLSVLIFCGLVVPAIAVGPAPHRIYERADDGTLRLKSNLDGVWIGDPDQATSDYQPQEDGIEHVLVIRVDFADQVGQKPASVFEDAFFGSGPSLHTYYNQLTRNTATPMVITHPDGPAIYPADGSWVRLENNMSYYGQPDPNTSYPDHLNHLREMAQEALSAVLNEVNMADYDRDGDGVLDHLIIVHAGNDEAETGRLNDLWSLRFATNIGVYNGILVKSAIVLPENPDSDQLPLGTICHEFFHGFGVPDLYDYQLDGTFGEPVGSWSLMGGGSFQGNGQAPAAICGYLQWDFDGDPENGMNGWITPTDITYSQQNIPVYRLGESATQSLYRIFIPGTNNTEYFLIENRYESDEFMYDQDLIGPNGLLIWHVDEKMKTTAYPHPIGFNDGPNLTPYYRLWLEDAGDPEHKRSWTLPTAAFSRENDRSFLSLTSQPSTAPNGQERGQIKIYDISVSGEIMTFSVDFNPQTPTETSVTRNYPNPFNVVTQVEFTLAEPQKCDFSVYNVVGQLVYYQNLGTPAEGEYEVTWDGRDSDGERVAMGQYFYELKIGSSSQIGRMIWYPEFK